MRRELIAGLVGVALGAAGVAGLTLRGGGEPAGPTIPRPAAQDALASVRAMMPPTLQRDLLIADWRGDVLRITTAFEDHGPNAATVLCHYATKGYPHVEVALRSGVVLARSGPSGECVR